MSASPPDRLVAIEIATVTAGTGLNGWESGPYSDDPAWPDTSDWPLIAALRARYDEPFASAVCHPRVRKHLLVRTTDGSDVLAADLLLLDEGHSPQALLAVHFGLHAGAEHEVRAAQQEYEKRMPDVVRGIGLDGRITEPLALLLCVPSPVLVPEPQVWTSGYRGHY